MRNDEIDAMAGNGQAVVADDLTIVRYGLKLLVEECGFADVVEGASLSDVREAVLDPARDTRLLLTDACLRGTDVLPSLPRLLSLRPELRIVVAGPSQDVTIAQEATRAGAQGYVCKTSRVEDLRAAIMAVLAGGQYIDASLTRQLFHRRHPRAVAGLSPRELNVLHMISDGLTNRQAASRLNVSVRTVEECRAGIRRKTGFSDRSELTAFAKRLRGLPTGSTT